MDRTGQIIDIGTKVTKGGATAAASSPFVNWAIDNSEMISLTLGFGGFIIGVGGFAVTWYYAHQRHQLLIEQSKRD